MRGIEFLQPSQRSNGGGHHPPSLGVRRRWGRCVLIAGCDRGFAGALCFLDPEAMRVVAMIDMPTLTVGKGSGGKRREISPQMRSRASLRSQLSHSQRPYWARRECTPPRPSDCRFRRWRGHGMGDGDAHRCGASLVLRGFALAWANGRTPSRAYNRRRVRSDRPRPGQADGSGCGRQFHAGGVRSPLYRRLYPKGSPRSEERHRTWRQSVAGIRPSSWF